MMLYGAGGCCRGLCCTGLSAGQLFFWGWVSHDAPLFTLHGDSGCVIKTGWMYELDGKRCPILLGTQGMTKM